MCPGSLPLPAPFRVLTSQGLGLTGPASPAPSAVLGTWQELRFPELKYRTQVGTTLLTLPPLSPDQPKMLTPGTLSPRLPWRER